MCRPPGLPAKGVRVKRSNAELVVGGVIIVALFILVAGVLWLKEVSVSRKLVQYTVLFPNIGTLQQGDPVTVNGVRSGNVAKIQLQHTQVAVQINLDKTVIFTDSSTATVQNIGLMGERKVEIQISAKGSPHIPDTKKEVRYIQGRFDSGIAEAMGMLGTVLGEVTALVDTVQTIVDKTVGDTSFVTFFKTVTHRLDTVLYLAEALVADNGPDVTATVDDLRATVKSLRSLVDDNKGSINTIAKNGEQLSDDAVVLVARADSIATTLKSILDGIDRGEGAVGVLLKDSTILTDIRQSLADVDTLVKDVNARGLKLRVKLGFGRNKRN